MAWPRLLAVGVVRSGWILDIISRWVKQHVMTAWKYCKKNRMTPRFSARTTNTMECQLPKMGINEVGKFNFEHVRFGKS